MSETKDRRSFLAAAAVAGVACANVESASAQTEQTAVARAVAEQRRKAEEAAGEDRAAYGKALVERFGPDVIAVIEATTIRRAKGWLEAAKLEHRGLAEVKSELWNHIGPPFEWTIVEETPKTLAFRVTRCPHAERMRAHGAGDIGYAYSCAYDIGFCQGLNPKMRFIRTKTLMKGDDCCDHRYELD